MIGIDLWSHSFYYDFIFGNKLKQIEYNKKNKIKYNTKQKESIGQSIDVKHIGTSLQKTFNYPRTRMEMFGYYINSFFNNLDWNKIAKRWRKQCKKKITHKISSNDDIIKNKNDIDIKTLHQEL